MSIELSKGANTPVPTATLFVELAWETGASSPELDTSALVLGPDGKTSRDEDFVFYNQPRHPSGAVEHLGKSPTPSGVCDTVRIDVAAVPADVSAVVLVASADGSTFADVTGLHLRLRDGAGTEVLRFDVTEAGPETALVLGEVYRRNGAWKLRAVGQGYASGLAGVATDYGIDVTEDEPASAAPGAGEAVSPAGHSSTPIDMRKRLDMRKRAVKITLEKKGLTGARAQVAIVLDASGSMDAMYKRGTVGDVVERMAAIAASLDDDGSMQAWTFAGKPAQLPELKIDGLSEWIRLHVRPGGRKPQLNLEPGQIDMHAVGRTNEEHLAIADVIRHFTATSLTTSVPVLVLFFSDGGVNRSKAIASAITEAASLPIFWQFVGLGAAKYGILERLDTLPGRLVDNVGFFAVDDIDTISDGELYDRLLSEFPSWLRDARRAGVLP